jgi:prepilin-type processing-associated H-X9-DG protein
LAPYLKSGPGFKCRSDQSYAIRGGERYLRVRSYSMNGYISESSRITDLGRLHYYKSEQFSRPGASQTFVFLDEHEDSINDGFFIVGLQTDEAVGWNDVPANRHRRASNFAFADGHAERHRWRDSRTIQPVTRNRLFGLFQSNNPDVKWVHQHATAQKKLSTFSLPRQ